jgi:hypothetical protein
MFGEKLKLTTMRCCVCGKMVALRVDPEDVARVRGPENPDGVLVQHAFVRRDGTPYLTADERELFIPVEQGGGTCLGCWKLLCPSSKLAYN